MNNFIVEVKEKDGWKNVTAVFPYTSGDLLDERLDEAKVTFFSRTKAYLPLTEFRITFYKNQDLNQRDNDADDKNVEYFILANDNSAEYPAGSGKYRHEVYLIERTKLLEGVLCPSLTFTNSLILNYKSTINSRVYATSFSQSNPLPSSFDGISDITTPIVSVVPYITPSVETVGEAVIEAANDSSSIFEEFEYYNAVFDPASQSMLYSSYNIYLDNTLLAENLTDIYQITPQEMLGKTKLRIDYTITTGIYNYAAQSWSYFQYSVRFEIEILKQNYTLKPYTITDCVNRVLELAEPLREGENPRFSFDGVTYTDGTATSYRQGSQAEKYEKIQAPEFTMTQSTLREQLKVIGSYIHAEPWLDENNVIHFLEYGVQKQSGIAGSPYISNTLKTDINQYCTDIRSNAQNLVSSLGFARGVITDPSPKLYRSLRAEAMYVRVNEQNGIAQTVYPIYSVEKVECGLLSAAENTATEPFNGWIYEPKDITPYVFEATEYGANLNSFNGGYPYSKKWAIYYTMGQKGLHGLFFQVTAPKDPADEPFAISNILAAVNGLSSDTVHQMIIKKGAQRLAFKITYKPITPAFISHGKQYYISGDTPYTQIFNQGENLIETQYFGENMKGVAARLGNIEQTRTYMLSSRKQIPKTGEMLDGYAISAVHVEYMPKYIKCTLGLSKDFNRISEYVGVNSVKRMYEISERQAINRDILYKEYIVITDDASLPNDNGTLFKNIYGFINAFGNYLDSIDYLVKAFIFQGYKKDNTSLLSSIILPCIGRSFGNTIHFSATLKDNYSAGDAVEWKKYNDDIKGRWQIDTPYTDFYGRIYWANLQLLHGFSQNISSAGTIPSTSGVYNFVSFGNMNIDNMNSKKMRLRKDNREILTFNIEAEFKAASPDLIIGSELAANSRFISTNKPNIKVYMTKDELNNLNEFWEFDSNNSTSVNTILSVSGGDSLIKITLPYTAPNYKNFVICTVPDNTEEQYVDEDGNIQTLNINQSRKILLAGEITDKFVSNNENGPPSNVTYTRTLYFRIKRS